MFNLDDERAVSRGKHDAPVIPIPAHIRRGLSESAYLAQVSARTNEKHAAIRAEALAIISRVDGKVATYRRQMRRHAKLAEIANLRGEVSEYEREMRVAKYYAGRSVQLKTHATALNVDLVLADTDIAPYKTISWRTGLIRELLLVQIVTESEFIPQPYKAPPSRNSPAPRTPDWVGYIPHYPPATLSEAELKALCPRPTPEQEKDQLASILSAKRAERLAELGL